MRDFLVAQIPLLNEHALSLRTKFEEWCREHPSWTIDQLKAHPIFNCIARLPAFCLQPVTLCTPDGLTAGFDRMKEQLRKQITSQGLRYVPLDVREALTLADSSCACSAKQAGEDTKLHSKQESEVWAGIGRAAFPDMDKVSAMIMGGADAGLFVKKMIARFGYDELMNGEGHNPEWENIFLNIVFG